MFPELGSQPSVWFWYAIIAAAGVILLFIGYKVGRWLGAGSQRRLVARREDELFQAQRGFKKVYDDQLSELRGENAKLKEEASQLNKRVEEYRRKAAGYGSLFKAGGRRADAMYALLLENETLEEALFAQNDKLRQERVDALSERLHSADYRRVLMSQLIEESKLKGTADKGMASATLSDDTVAADHRLPPSSAADADPVKDDEQR